MMEPSWQVVILVKQDNPEDVANVVDEAVWGTIKSRGGLDNFIGELKNNGACYIGPFHNDIAESLRFRMMQIANRLSLYSMSVRIAKMRSTNENVNVHGRINNANVN